MEVKYVCAIRHLRTMPVSLKETLTAGQGIADGMVSGTVSDRTVVTGAVAGILTVTAAGPGIVAAIAVILIGLGDDDTFPQEFHIGEHSCSLSLIHAGVKACTKQSLYRSSTSKPCKPAVKIPHIHIPAYVCIWINPETVCQMREVLCRVLFF